MDRRKEDRIKGILPVRLSATDVFGEPFQELAHTLDISPCSARVGAVRRELKIGDRVTVQYRQQKTEFRVVWIRPLEGTSEYQIGLETLAPGKDAWGLPVGVAVRREQYLEDPKRSTTMGMIACDRCGAEFLISHRPGFADPQLAEKQAKWLERVFAEDHHRHQPHPDKLELPG
jgi:hypothetical protein